MTNDDNQFNPSVYIGKDLDRYYERQDALLEFSKLFKYEEENHRVIAIIGGAFLDMTLEHILYNFLVDDNNEIKEILKVNGGALGTYSSRTRMCYCLGLIGKNIHDDLKLVGRIRNKFAHNLYASFEDKEIIDWCKKLKCYQILMFRKPLDDPRAIDLFKIAVNQVIAHLNGIVLIARNEKRTINPYP
jgi:DNA-binding MltR family transcriptional regulator